jgi:mono/diheme cytochrome c family protein
MSRPFRRYFSFCALLFGIAVFIHFSASPHIVHASSSAAHRRGAYLFETAGCERCHSITGVGGVRAPDLGNVGLKRGAGRIRKQIMNGGHGMPPFGKVLKKDEVDDLVDFLMSCRTKTAPGCRQWMPILPNSQSASQ